MVSYGRLMIYCDGTLGKEICHADRKYISQMSDSNLQLVDLPDAIVLVHLY